MLKRSREGRTEGISTDDLDEAVMDADSEVTSDKEIVKPEAFQKAWITEVKRAPNGKSGIENVEDAFFKAYNKKYSVDWRLYKNGNRVNDLYVMKINYYYFQANNLVTLEEFNRTKKNYQEIPAAQAVFHNVVNGKINIGSNKNTKYVSYNDGKEVVIDSKGNVVKDPVNRGTANRYTYNSDNDPDKLKHGVDISNWIIWGTGIDDTSNVYERIRLLALGGIVSKYYEEMDRWAKVKGISLIGEVELLEFSIEKGKIGIMDLFRQDVNNLKDKYDNSLNFTPGAIVPSMYLGR